jgi:hypothetical protein
VFMQDLFEQPCGDFVVWAIWDMKQFDSHSCSPGASRFSALVASGRLSVT